MVGGGFIGCEVAAATRTSAAAKAQAMARPTSRSDAGQEARQLRSFATYHIKKYPLNARSGCGLGLPHGIGGSRIATCGAASG
jgi:hypothetical protein